MMERQAWKKATEHQVSKNIISLSFLFEGEHSPGLCFSVFAHEYAIMLIDRCLYVFLGVCVQGKPSDWAAGENRIQRGKLTGIISEPYPRL